MHSYYEEKVSLDVNRHLNNNSDCGIVMFKLFLGYKKV